VPDAAGKIIKIYNGINLERFHENGIAPEYPFRFLCVARFVEKKGHAVLLQSCKRLCDRGIDFQCLLVGQGRLESQIETAIQELGLQERVKVLGPLTQMDVRNCYQSSHAFVVPCVMASDGNRDGLPVSIVEALACGLPVITTPLTGIPEVVHHQHNGILVPTLDAAALADAMESLISDSAFYRRLKSNARSSVKNEFNLSLTINMLEELFDQCSR